MSFKYRRYVVTIPSPPGPLSHAGERGRFGSLPPRVAKGKGGDK
jgi:hypothetical protein